MPAICGNLQSLFLLIFFMQATTKINMAVDRLPNFKCCNSSSAEGGPEHVGTIHIGSERYSFKPNIYIQMKKL